MVKELAEAKLQLAQVTGQVAPTEEEILGLVLGTDGKKDAATNDVRDKDVPYTKPSKEFVDTQTVEHIPGGATRFDVHCMIGIVLGQSFPSVGKDRAWST